MLLIFPRKYVRETKMSPKKVLRKLDGELTEYRPTLNILSTGRFMKKHKEESLYYGRHNADSFELYYHQAKKRDGGSTGFFGKIEKTENGTRISGKFRKPVYAYVFAVFWLILCLLCSLGTYAAGSQTGAYVFLGVALVGILLTFWDDKQVYLMGYLEGFPETEDGEDDEK